jgi:hypothetical protein
MGGRLALVLSEEIVVGDQDKGISTAPAAGFYNLVQHLIAGDITALLLRRPAFGEGEATG